MKGIWALIKFIGKFIQGLGTFALGMMVLATILIIMVISSFSRTHVPSVPNGAVLMLWPQGQIVELAALADPLESLFPQYSSQVPETSIYDITNALKLAKDDNRIAAMAIITDNMAGASPSHLHTIAQSIRDFKSSGKKVYAISTSYSQATYMIAAEADKIFMNPEGSVLLNGFGSYPMYYKSLLDKIGATVNVFRVGTYKSAVEPFIRDDMSDAAKEANLDFLGRLWDQYTSSVETARGMEAGSIDASIAAINTNMREAGGDFAKLAQNTGLVDELAPRQQWRQELMQEYGQIDSGTSFKQIQFEAYLAAAQKHHKSKNKIAVITAQGEIVMGEGPINVAAAETLVSYIREARNDPNTSAIVLRVDSPGGSATASELIRQELVAAQESGIKVIASMGPVAASGGYWISSTSDEIWAQPSTITGSIGIFGIIPTFEKTLDTLGLHSDGVGTTDLAGAFNTARPLSDKTKDIMQQTIESGYDKFISLVSAGRNIPKEDVDKIAQGRVWSGDEAFEHGLVDHLGGFDDAVKAAAAAAGVEDYELVFYRDRPDEMQQFIAEILNSTSSLEPTLPVFGKTLNPLLQQASQLAKDTAFLQTLNDPQGKYVICLVCNVQED